MSQTAPFSVRFPPQDSGGPSEEAYEVTFADGRVERFTMHDYGRVYAVPGLYEEVVQRLLECATPARVAALLAAGAAATGRAPGDVRVLDLGAGNGVSGEALLAQGLRPVAAIDLVPEAREATLRDRPGVYETVLTADLTALTQTDAATLRALDPNALTLVGALGDGHVPAEALTNAALLLAEDALVAYAFPAADGDEEQRRALAALGETRELARERYRHRRTAGGGERTWEAAVVRLRREARDP
jgi:predicted TPR repeat methyltransferase